MVSFVCYGGKGGVGKTTMAAATGVGLADRPGETLLVSTDPAHSLSDALAADVGEAPTSLAAGLAAVEVDPATRMEAYRAMATDLAADLRTAGLRVTDEDVADLFEAGVLPGGDEVAALDLLVEYADAYDRVVLDTAPTGHALRLLELPGVVDVSLSKALSIRGQVARLADTARSAFLGPMASLGRDREGEDDLAALRDRMERARELLADPARTEFRVVFVPQSMVVAETERLVERLRAADVPLGTLVANQVLTDIDEDCTRCRSRRDSQRDQLAAVRERFPDLPVATVPELSTEPRGLEGLAAVAEHLQLPAAG